MFFEILTLFPEIFESFLAQSLIRRAVEQKLIGVQCHNFRRYGLGRHQQVDDAPYGGGSGMVLRVEPIHAALEECDRQYQQAGRARPHRILITPQGTPFGQKQARHIQKNYESVVLICGRYEGFDERVRSFVDEEISAGDYICLGGEVVAMLFMETISRLIPGVLGNSGSIVEESFSQGSLEYPQYTRPEEFQGLGVPEVLMSGNHQAITVWRQQQAKQRTLERRPDLMSI